RENGWPLHFQPPALDFGTQPLGLARAETIYIHNPSQEVPVTLLSMFTTSRHFYIPFFHRRVIPPRGKASFKLIFLPSEEGNVENTLFINTSAHGLLSYQEDDSNSTTLGLLLECNLPKSLFNSLQGSCLQSEEHLSLQINLLARGDRPADLDKLKPYVIEHILVLLAAPAAGPASIGPLPGHERKCVSHVSLKMLGNQTAHSFPGIHIAER
ncbi:unnamed protein product, partial [Tetraodon nigroviridis]